MTTKIKTYLFVLAAFTVLLTTPFWYIMLYWILSHLQAPTWIWVMYWGMLPVSVLVGILNKWLTSLLEEQTRATAYQDFLRKHPERR